MGKGGYNGGSTVIGPGSGWFKHSKKQKKTQKSALSSVTPKRCKEEIRSEAIERAAERLAKAQEEFDRGDWTRARGSIKRRAPSTTKRGT